jgi:flagellar biosynthetic protein FliQ
VEIALDLTREALLVAAKVALPLLAVAMLAGLLVSMVQSATQVHEPVLTLVPKLAAVGCAALLLLPWIVSVVADFATRAAGVLGGRL